MNVKQNQTYFYTFSWFPSSLHTSIYSFSRFSKHLWSFGSTFYDSFLLKNYRMSFFFPVQPVFCHILYLISCFIFSIFLIVNYLSSLFSYLLFQLKCHSSISDYLLAAFRSAHFHKLRLLYLITYLDSLSPMVRHRNLEVDCKDPLLHCLLSEIA